MLASLLPELLPVVGNVLDRFFPDKEANARAKRELEMQLASHLAELGPLSCGYAPLGLAGSSFFNPWLYGLWQSQETPRLCP